MASWEVRTRNNTVQVEGANWLLAVGAALGALELDASVLSRLICDVQSDGIVRIIDPISKTPLLVRRLADDVSASGARRVVPVGVVAGIRGNEPDVTVDDMDVAEAPSDEIDTTAPPPPQLHMPPPSDSAEALAKAAGLDISPPDAPTDAPKPVVAATEAPDLPAPPPPPSVSSILPEVPTTAAASSFKDDDLATLDDFDVSALPDLPTPSETNAAPDDLAERLFIESMDINEANDIGSAARTTLRILREVVPAEAGSVLFASINDTSLRFLAADGPTADEVMNVKVPFGHGIAGFCFDSGASLIIRNAAQDPRHAHEVDVKTGYRTQDLLSVALRDSAGTIHGCIQLLNPPKGFATWHLDAAGTLSTTLADFIMSRR